MERGEEGKKERRQRKKERPKHEVFRSILMGVIFFFNPKV